MRYVNRPALARGPLCFSAVGFPPQVDAPDLALELAARALGDPTRILAGTDCGFETSSGVSVVAADVAWAKLASLCEGAEIASRKLLG